MNPTKDGMKDAKTMRQEASPAVTLSATAEQGSEPRKELDLDGVRQRLQQAQGPQYWRSLEELAGSDEFQELLHREFPRFAAEWPSEENGNAGNGVSRRGFLELAASSLALAGLTACTRQPAETIVPFVRQPENYIPGHPLYYATAIELAGTALGLLAESHLGRPTKLEGNPEHPASLGATDALAQASVLSLYDPDRSQTQSYLGQISSWEDLAAEIRTSLPALEALQGDGLRILTRTVSSPTLAAQLTALEERLPKARWHQYEPCGDHAARAAAMAAFGRPLATRYDFSRADVILALDADFLTSGPGSVRYAKDFSRRRRSGLAQGGAQGMNRLYVAESSPSNTGATADHRLALAPSELLRFTAALAAELHVPGAASGAGAEEELSPPAREWIATVAADLAAHRGSCAVVPGVYAAPQVHLLAQAINATLGNVGSTVLHSEPGEARPEDQLASIGQLVADMRAGKVDTLLILEGNPAYDAPADLDFAETMLAQVKTRIHLSLYRDETSEYCQWHIPAAHFLESWSDCRAFDGTASIVQPLIEPLHGGRTAHEVVALFSDRAGATAHELVQEHWQGQGLDETGWRRALHDGVIAGTASATLTAEINQAAVAQACSESASRMDLELCLRPDPSVFDGRFANNAWLQELPKSLTKLTWDNAFLISPATAEEHGLKTEDLVEVRLGERKVVGPVWIMPGQADRAVTVHLGYGRTHAGRVGNGAGFNAYPLYTASTVNATVDIAVELAATGATYPLSSTQQHFAVELQSEEAHERHLVRHADYATYQHQPDFAQHMGHPPPGPEESMFPPWEYNGYAWGLAVDLNSCTGCNACVTACQSENNIPVVGKVQVANGREMHWIRIDRYYQGDLEDPDVHFQPVMCMHCEQAPCEVVCPVAATTHSSEGLNDMVYNRCVGTRYCSNNCPYKVRRFNFLSYTDHDSDLLAMARNPDVTVRSRGVMEKCSYCVQRINQARIEAKKQDREIRDGEIKTACQQACPADALTFGDINDADSAVSRTKASPLNYTLLGDLGTRPRTTYLAKVTNPNPALTRAAGEAGGHGQPTHEGGHG